MLLASDQQWSRTPPLNHWRLWVTKAVQRAQWAAAQQTPPSKTVCHPQPSFAVTANPVQSLVLAYLFVIPPSHSHNEVEVWPKISSLLAAFPRTEYFCKLIQNNTPPKSQPYKLAKIRQKRVVKLIFIM